MISNSYKICYKCKKEKNIDSFAVDNRAKHKLAGKCKSCDKNYREKNSLKIANYKKIWSKSEKAKAKRNAYKKNNPGKVLASTIKRKLIKKQRTPNWLTKDQLNKIEQFYVEAKELQWLSEEQLHVDHIVPLIGKNVSGLHVPWNLQILPKSINLAKSNKMEAFNAAPPS